MFLRCHLWFITTNLSMSKKVLTINIMVMRPQILHKQLWSQNCDFQLFLHVSHNVKLKLWHFCFFLTFQMLIYIYIYIPSHFHSLEVKILIFFVFFMVFGAQPCCFPHVFETDMLFLSVFSMFFDSNLPTPPSVNWKICSVSWLFR